MHEQVVAVFDVSVSDTDEGHLHVPLANLAPAVGLEVFADRAYQDDGQLVPRSQPGAMIHGAEASLQHVLRMLDAGGLVTRNGNVLKTDIHSICVHGDGPDAVASACALAAGLEMAGYTLSTLPQTLRP